jgi:hypothetical protein
MAGQNRAPKNSERNAYNNASSNLVPGEGTSAIVQKASSQRNDNSSSSMLESYLSDPRILPYYNGDNAKLSLENSIGRAKGAMDDFDEAFNGGKQVGKTKADPPPHPPTKY